MMRSALRFLCLFALAAAVLAPPTRAAGQGDEVVVVWNSRVPEPRDVAEHYSSRRQVPASQVFAVDLPADETISRADFNESLLAPLIRQMTVNGLLEFRDWTVPATNSRPSLLERVVVRAKVRYIVLCYGV